MYILTVAILAEKYYRIRERERDRQTDRHRERERDRQRDREYDACFQLNKKCMNCNW